MNDEMITGCMPVGDLPAIPIYGRASIRVPGSAHSAIFTSPSGVPEVSKAFDYQEVRFEYDFHGYESSIPEGPIRRGLRHTPTEIGKYGFTVMDGANNVLAEGSYTCKPSDHPGYVRVGTGDPRYFNTSTNQPYIPIGPCLVGPTGHRLPAGQQHFETGGSTAYMGLAEYDRWFGEISGNGGNYARIWLSNGYFSVDTGRLGEYDLTAFARVDGLLELARIHGIRLKLCLEHFRDFKRDSPGFFTKRLVDAEGRTPADMEDWLTDGSWQRAWRDKVGEYLARYGDDPVIFAWELWNEMNAVDIRDPGTVVEWTARTLEWLAPLTRNLCVNSLGSYDSDWSGPAYRAFSEMPRMPFQQVHRYLDQGAAYPLVREDCVAFSVDAVTSTRNPVKPCLLAETGAVNDVHTGPFRFYNADHRGVIFHDTTYPAFFAGAAGPGHIWHWDCYLDAKNLWWQYGPLAELIQGIDFDAEIFQPFDISTEGLWILGLKGTLHTLLWVRDKSDSWTNLRDGKKAGWLEGVAIDLTALNHSYESVEAIGIWGLDGNPGMECGLLHLPRFHGAMMLRMS